MGEIMIKVRMVGLPYKLIWQNYGMELNKSKEYDKIHMTINIVHITWNADMIWTRGLIMKKKLMILFGILVHFISSGLYGEFR